MFCDVLKLYEIEMSVLIYQMSGSIATSFGIFSSGEEVCPGHLACRAESICSAGLLRKFGAPWFILVSSLI